MAQIVTIINFKGGVGKTTCSVELSAALAKHYGCRTLLVDLDPQASATFYVMKQEHWRLWREKKGTSYTLFNEKEGTSDIRQAIVPEVVPGVFHFNIIPSDPNLVDVDLRLADFMGYNILRNYFDAISNDYDFIIRDCPPNFNPVTKNSIRASNAYVIPTIPDFLSTYGIQLLQRSVNKFFRTDDPLGLIPPAVLGGIILTRIKTNVTLHAQYRNQLFHEHPGLVFKHFVSDSIIIARAPDSHIPVSVLPNPQGNEIELQRQFKELAREFIDRIQHIGIRKMHSVL